MPASGFSSYKNRSFLSRWITFRTRIPSLSRCQTASTDQMITKTFSSLLLPLLWKSVLEFLCAQLMLIIQSFWGMLRICSASKAFSLLERRKWPQWCTNLYFWQRLCLRKWRRIIFGILSSGERNISSQNHWQCLATTLLSTALSFAPSFSQSLVVGFSSTSNQIIISVSLQRECLYHRLIDWQSSAVWWH